VACQSQSPVKTVTKIDVVQSGEEVHLTCRAPSFLHHQIRNFVGSLQLVGKGRWEPRIIQTILEAKNRAAAGPTAPAQGLYFLKVSYPKDCTLPLGMV
jgi:tRNA pseudouridine38-40 synthase